MTGIVALGARERVEGFALAGVRVMVADEPDAIRAAWGALGPEVAVALLTPAAQAALADLLAARPEVIWTTIPG
jgi:vacuolar-type H+-ATPase subunit F/Vma7